MIIVFEFARNGLWDDVWEEIKSDCLFINQNELVHACDPQTGKTLLHFAVEQFICEAVEDLVAVWQINVHVRDYAGRTALDLAQWLKEKNPSQGFFLDEMIALMQEAGQRQPAY